MKLFSTKLLLQFLLVILITKTNFAQKPKLVVGIVVDQMRYEYIDRFWNKFGDDGFKALVDEGISYTNMHYNYVPTYTAPGHASIYTGTTPRNHGIIANDWYDRDLKETVYCVDDKNQKTLGSNNNSGEKSPHQLLSSTITDYLKIQTKGEGKTIGIAIKDRGAILPAGHMANAAYWFDSETGNWVSSSYYMSKLPIWVNEFNNIKLPDYYINKTWNTILPINDYTESLPDNNPYERVLKGKKSPTFPYKLSKLKNNYEGYELIKTTPFGNTLTTDFAINTIENEKMGSDEITDFLCVSYSSTDYIGHAFGPRSVEIEDTYIRLDREIEKLITFLDNTVGTDDYVLFLTSDHGVAENPDYISNLRKKTGFFNRKNITLPLNKFLFNETQIPDSIFAPACLKADYYINQQIYLNKNCGDYDESITKTLKYVNQLNGVANSYYLNENLGFGDKNKIANKIFEGYHTKRSGDVYINLLPGWIEHKMKGSDHGSPYKYDSHVPFIIYSSNITAKKIDQEHKITQIVEIIGKLTGIEIMNY